MRQTYAALAELAPLLAEREPAATAGFRPALSATNVADLADQRWVSGDVAVTAHFVDPWTPRDRQRPETHGALLVMLDPADLLVAGRGVTFTFEPAAGSGSIGSSGWRMGGSATAPGSPAGC